MISLSTKTLRLKTYLDALHFEFGSRKMWFVWVIYLKGLVEIIGDELCRRIIEHLGKLKGYLYCSGSGSGVRATMS